MEALKTYFEELEHAYDSYIKTASETACYAIEHPEISYNGSLETFELGLDDYSTDQLLEQGLIETQNQSLKVQDKIQRLSREMEKYRERKDDKPKSFFHLGERFSELKTQFRELDSEITDMMKEFDRTDKEKIQKQRSIIGTREAEKITASIDYEPR